jgi:hypothetical protein
MSERLKYLIGMADWIVPRGVVYDPRLGEVGDQPVITADSLGA